MFELRKRKVKIIGTIRRIRLSEANYIMEEIRKESKTICAFRKIHELCEVYEDSICSLYFFDKNDNGIVVYDDEWAV